MFATLYVLALKLAVLSAVALLVGGALILLGRFCALTNVRDDERPHEPTPPVFVPAAAPEALHCRCVDPFELLVPYIAPDGERVLSDREMVALRADLARGGVTL